MVNMQKIAFWLGVIVVSILVMMRPASADQLPPTDCWQFNGGAVTPASPVCMATSAAVTAWYASVHPVTDPVSGNTYHNFTLVDNGTGANRCYYYISPAQNRYPSTGCISQVLTWSHYQGCPTGYTLNGAYCVSAACPTNTVAASGLFDIGPNPDRVFDGILNGCGANNCATAVGSLDPISKRGIIGGETHYFSVGVIVFTGQTCAAGTPSVATASDPNIQQTCGAGQTAVTGANGFFRCYADSNSPPASAVPTTTTQTTTGTTTTTDQTTGASSVTTTTTVSETVTTGGGGAAATTTTPADPLTDYCAQTPSAEVCKEGQPSGTVTTPSVDGLYDGQLNATGHQTVSDVVGTFKNRVLAAPVGSAVSGFFNVTVASGTCPVWSADVPMFGVLTMDAYCAPWFLDLLPLIKSLIMIVFSVAAFRIAVL
jgi:hypothetical protein